MNKVSNVHTASPKAVYVGRGSVWGNPYRIGEHSSREDVIHLYRELLWKRLRGSNGSQWFAALLTLRGAELSCHCAPKPCHADVIASAVAWAVERHDSYITDCEQMENGGMPTC